MVGLQPRSIIVFVPKYGIEGQVRRVIKSDGQSGSWDYVLSESGNVTTSKVVDRHLRVFDKVTVRIEVKISQGFEEGVIMSLVECNGDHDGAKHGGDCDAMDEA